jgi:hypothetical protein
MRNFLPGLSNLIPKFALVFARHFPHSGGSRNPVPPKAGFNPAFRAGLDPGACPGLRSGVRRGDHANGVTGDGILLESAALP